ncbi:MAG: siderophore-interacting protein [Micrococcaceae bacterium]
MSSPFKAFTAKFHSKKKLSSSLCRVKFTGNFDNVHYLGLDQRIKLIFPLPNCDSFKFNNNEHWYEQWKKADHDTRGTMRTYTIRELNESELLVDFVIHQPATSPAMRWLDSVSSDETISIVLPLKDQTEFVRPRLLGVEWNPPEAAKELALYADLTSLPAATQIVKSHIENNDERILNIYLQVPHPDDAKEIHKLIHGRKGIGLEYFYENIEKDDGAEKTILWDVTTEESNTPFYAWVAAERSVVKQIRQQLKLNYLKIDVSCMGYWRKGESSLD